MTNPGFGNRAAVTTGEDSAATEETAAEASGWRSTARRHWRWARWPTATLGALVVFGLLAFMWLWHTVNLPADLPPLHSSIVVDAKGREIATFEQNGLREPVRLEQVSPVVLDALISAEDRHFFDHRGVDPGGIVRALWQNATGGSMQGGSTITQQLVKNSYLNSDRSLSRKTKEAILAIKLEQTHDKRDILERYLNIVYFGRGSYGIQAAAHVYFNTTADQVNANQAAFLVGLLRSPETADPTRDPDTTAPTPRSRARCDGGQRQARCERRRRESSSSRSARSIAHNRHRRLPASRRGSSISYAKKRSRASVRAPSTAAD